VWRWWEACDAQDGIAGTLVPFTLRLDEPVPLVPRTCRTWLADRGSCTLLYCPVCHGRLLSTSDLDPTTGSRLRDL
jgi:hypothetical protein